MKKQIPKPKPKEVPKIKSEFNIERIDKNKYKITGHHEQILDANQMYMRFSNLLSEKSRLKLTKKSNEDFMKGTDLEQIKKLAKLSEAVLQAKENNRQVDIQLNGLVKEEAQIRKLMENIKGDIGRKEKSNNIV